MTFAFQSLDLAGLFISLGAGLAALLVWAAASYGIEWRRKERTHDWPTASGAVGDVSTAVDGPEIDYLRVHFSYTYVVAGNNYSGSYHVNCSASTNVKDINDILHNGKLIVHYNPRKPARSVLWNNEVEDLMQTTLYLSVNL